MPEIVAPAAKPPSAVAIITKEDAEKIAETLSRALHAYDKVTDPLGNHHKTSVSSRKFRNHLKNEIVRSLTRDDAPSPDEEEAERKRLAAVKRAELMAQLESLEA